MKKIIETNEGEGLEKLLGEIITCYCINYIYTGKLKGINDKYILLENPKIVYETGDYKEKEWKDAQALPHDFYIMLQSIESFGILKL